MTHRNEQNSHPSAAKHAPLEESSSAGALADAALPRAFDRSLSCLVRQLEAMAVAGWVTTVDEPTREGR